MPTPDGLPADLEEYLEVWCEDLIAPLARDQRWHVSQTVCRMYEGGPWPGRDRVQRLAEIARGVLTADDVVRSYGHDEGRLRTEPRDAPPLVPLPDHLRPVPSDYPESVGAFLSRSEPYRGVAREAGR